MKLCEFSDWLNCGEYHNTPELFPVIKQHLDKRIAQQLAQWHAGFAVNTQYDGFTVKYTVHCEDPETLMFMRLGNNEQGVCEHIMMLVHGAVLWVEQHMQEIFSVQV